MLDVVQPLQSFLTYLDRVAPGYLNQIAGDLNDSLALGAYHEKQPLPGVYTSFLAVMGRGTGPDLFPNYSFNAVQILEWYADGGADEWPMSDAYHLLALSTNDWDYRELVLSLNEPIGDDDVLVFEAEQGHPLEEARESNGCFCGLRDMLYFEVFTKIHLKQWQTPIKILRATRTSEEIDTLMCDVGVLLDLAGLEVRECTSAWLHLYEGPNLLVCVHRLMAEPWRVGLYLSGRDLEETQQFVRVLLERYEGLRDVTPA